MVVISYPIATLENYLSTIKLNISLIAGHEFIVPPLWKRIAAEFIDFFFLFMIKLGITLLTVEYVGVL